MAVEQLVDSSIDENTITIFSKSWCPYCKASKGLFQREFPDVPTKIFELDQMEEGAEIQAYLAKKTGQRTVPNIFVNKEHIGGNDDTQAAFKSGKLTTLVAA
ncbi:glutaredoxin [Lentinula raphanica]|uniref:glutathione peroxidase n=1 Tax=Lentinula raphanica TaxID=153919 RepID=A0AA38PAY1_9AGAR|nr:glutaredoxin [Lentinula raphanica]KAJ3839569.1 glutaredoxin [Lentinula raphanica]KAJ3969380.1 glutaredoxin [Lentinula raphanica]